MLAYSTSLKFPGLLELQKWQPVYPHIVGRIPNSIGRQLTLSKTQVRGSAAAAVVNATRSVLGRIQRLELTSYQCLVKSLATRDHIRQEDLVHGDHARLQEGHLGLHPVLEDPPRRSVLPAGDGPPAP